jgi:diaminohydroxyphosphoribosylaminopyrimidine deaminase / 5-amino-6-(5-phosphoribosylamino)uracil reductase
MTDEDWMAEAVALGEEARGSTAPNPNVGCVLVKDGHKIAEGATRPGGRPHAEAVALEHAGDRARGATAYVTLEPCAHESARGPACAPSLAAAGIVRVAAALQDPDPRTSGRGFALLREAGIQVDVGTGADAAGRSLEGFLTRMALGRPFVTLKLAMSIDGCIALADGSSRWITGKEARNDVHEERARADMILVGRGTLDADDPKLDVRIAGKEHLSPRRAVLTRGTAPDGWRAIERPEAIHSLHDVNDLLIEGGAETAAAFLRADLIDRLLIYRAPILIGGGKHAIGDLGLNDLRAVHGRWRASTFRTLGSDRLEVYERVRS